MPIREQEDREGTWWEKLIKNPKLPGVNPECAQGVLGVALSCIDHIAVIWGAYCDLCAKSVLRVCQECA